MAQNFNLFFTNGIAPMTKIQFGTYNLSDVVIGYGGALTPSQITAPNDIVNGALPITLKGTGTLTLIVYGPDDITPIPDAVFNRYISETDTTAYSPISGIIDRSNASTGIYVINDVPYNTSGGYNLFLSISSEIFNVKNQRKTILMLSQSISQTISIGL